VSELEVIIFDLPGEYVLDLKTDGARLESLSSPFEVFGDGTYSDRFD